MGAFAVARGARRPGQGGGLMVRPPSGHRTIGGICAGTSIGRVSLDANSVNIDRPLSTGRRKARTGGQGTSNSYLRCHVRDYPVEEPGSWPFGKGTAAG